MEKLGWYDFQAEGLSLERLLNQCAEQGIRLRGVRKATARRVTGSVAAADWQKLRALSEARGWKLTMVRAHGAVRFKGLFRRRAMLLAGVVAFAAICWGLVSCVWSIEVRGAGPYTGEVERILLEHEVGIGRFMYFIDTDALREDMERQLTGLAWVGVQKNGVRLTVSCVQAQLAEGKSAVPGDLVAGQDGVVASVTVVSGTPLVKAGDVVKKGQVLVRGEERAWDGAVNAVRAEASVMARVWYTASAYVSGELLETERTGESYTVRTFCVPYFEYALEEAPVYQDYDLHETVLPIGGSFPVWLKLSRYEAVTREPVPRDAGEVREEAGLAASRLAQEKMPYGVEIVDKWVEYSMIDGGGCRATAVLETRQEIAVTQAETLSN